MCKLLDYTLTAGAWFCPVPRQDATGLGDECWDVGVSPLRTRRKELDECLVLFPARGAPEQQQQRISHITIVSIVRILYVIVYWIHTPPLSYTQLKHINSSGPASASVEIQDYPKWLTIAIPLIGFLQSLFSNNWSLPVGAEGAPNLHT